MKRAAMILALVASSAQAQAQGGLTADEAMAFRDDIMACWNIAANPAASRISVSVAFAMDPQGKPRPETMRMTDQKGGTSTADIVQAYDAARRAIMRCAGEGYDLPQSKYASWQSVVIEFVPIPDAAK